MVYSEISSEKWWGDETTTGEFDKALKEARKSGARNLNIRINSPGGEVYAAVAMRSMVINSGFERIRVMIEGLCASAATLFATIPEAKVVIAEGSEFMIHNPMTITWGNAQDIEKTVDHLHKLEEQFHDMYASKTGLETDQIKEWMDATTWFSAKEAVQYGFCDELLETEKIAACVTKRDMALMKDIYANVPESIKEYAEGGVVTAGMIKEAQELILPPKDNVSNGSPVAGEPSEIDQNKEENLMELENLTMDQLREGNPALFTQVQQEAVAAERERLEEIDALTVAGCEEMAAQAKANGTSALEFHKMIVKAQKERGQEFIAARTEETAPAQDVTGGAPDETTTDEDQEIQDNAKEIAKYAEQYNNGGGSGMF